MPTPGIASLLTQNSENCFSASFLSESDKTCTNHFFTICSNPLAIASALLPVTLIVPATILTAPSQTNDAGVADKNIPGRFN